MHASIKKSFGRHVILFVLIIGVILISKVSFSETEHYVSCGSSQECYALLKEKAQRFRIKQTDFSQHDNSKRPSFEQFSIIDPNDYDSETENDKIDPSLSDSLEFEGARVNNRNILVSLKEENDDSDEQLVDKNEDEDAENTLLPRVKAAFVVLVRNSELYQLRSSMRYLEDRFNKKYNYPWIFLNDEPFTEEFKNMTSMMTNAKIDYGLIPVEQWSYPDWIDQNYAAEARRQMAELNIVYGGSESYRHMCRYQSGFFMLHPLLDDLDYYWRVEPGVRFSCDIDYDPFRLMQDRDLKYGFTIALREYRATIPTLWNRTIDFSKKYPQYIFPQNSSDSLLGFVSDDKGSDYNLCHFWSNFEIASVKFMRSEAYQSYFKFLDKAGGFFYERWGDAPVHSIAVALMLGRNDVHWFYDIGYKHDFFEHCPTEPSWLTNGKCYCEPSVSFVHNPGSCHNQFLNVMSKTASSFIVTQPDPEDILYSKNT